MPELPDVELFKRYFDATALHQTIETVEIRNDIILKDCSIQTLESALVGQTFAGTERHGKYLFVEVKDSNWLVLHFGMTGDLKYFKKPDKEPDYSQLLIGFSNDYHLAYILPRKLGRVRLTEAVGPFLERNRIGPDALKSDFTVADFQEIMAGTRSMVKSALMDQKKMAGIGNVYADEILFQASLHPKTKANDLDEEALEDLFKTMKDVLETAIEHRADPGQFPDSWLTPHRNEQATCPRCGTDIEQIKASGRSTYYCPTCQKQM
jgi:formamidopyrimidine-DNA glycosylase